MQHRLWLAIVLGALIGCSRTEPPPPLDVPQIPSGRLSRDAMKGNPQPMPAGKSRNQAQEYRM